MLQQGLDFTVQSDGSILFASGSIPQVGDALQASYRTGGAAAIVVPQPLSAVASVQVLCNGSGAGMSGATMTLLGGCNIPGRTLAVGDRVEIRFTLSHEGTARGFNFQVNWNDTPLVARAGSTKDMLVTGHGDASIGASATALDMQTWGTSLALESKVALTTDVLNSDIQIGFLGALTAAGIDTLTLQSFTVLRYPAQ